MKEVENNKDLVKILLDIYAEGAKGEYKEKLDKVVYVYNNYPAIEFVRSEINSDVKKHFATYKSIDINTILHIIKMHIDNLIVFHDYITNLPSESICETFNVPQM